MTSATIASPTESSSARWLLRMFGLLGLILMIHLFITWRMDVFGVLRNPQGRALMTSHHERKAKWLLNQSYVPTNFDALIVGASASVNWHMSELTGYRFYNESLEGGDAIEERKLVEQALAKGHFKVAIVALHPHITQVHYFWDGLDKANRGEALGSLNSFQIETDTLANRYLHHTPMFFPDGSHVMPTQRPLIPKPGDPKLDVSQDPAAVKDYGELTKVLMDHGIRVVYVFYPYFGPQWDHSQDELQRYIDTTLQTLPPAPLINFNTPEYSAFRNNPDNYMDEVHLTPSGSIIFSRMLNERLHQALHDQ